MGDRQTPASRRPLFLFSLPRSGSTLLQRLLGAHDQVTTTAEPWILLPLLYAREERGIYAAYDQVLAARAVNDFARSLEGGSGAYDAALVEFVHRLYDGVPGAAGGYFLDKTPRYHLVADRLLQLFPDARAVFLWRNPLAVAASFMETFASGRWNLHLARVDLYEGLERLVDVHAANAARVCAVRYEDLVQAPETTLARVCAYLEIPFDPSLLSDFTAVDLPGIGDPTGRVQYRAVTDAPVDKWQAVMANPVRKAWGRRYLRWIGDARLGAMGYDAGALRRELSALPTSRRGVASDVARMSLGAARAWVEPQPFRDKVERLRGSRRIYNHP